MTVAAVKSKAAIIGGELGGVMVEAMLDLGSSVSLVQSEVLQKARGIEQVKGAKPLRLVTASGNSLPIVDHIRAPIRIGKLKLMHEFVVVQSLVAPVILGTDFLHNNALLLDFTKTPVRVCSDSIQSAKTDIESTAVVEMVQPMYQSARKEQVKTCAIVGIEQPGTDVIDECAVPMYQKPASIDLPECPKHGLRSVVCKYQSLFYTTPGVTDAAHHFIPTIGNSVRVLPRRIPTYLLPRGS